MMSPDLPQSGYRQDCFTGTNPEELAPVKDMDHGRRQRTNDDAMASELQIEERA